MLKKKEKQSYVRLRRGDVQSHLCSHAQTVFDDCIFCFPMTHVERSLCLLLCCFTLIPPLLCGSRPIYVLVGFFFVTAGNV